MYTRGIKSVCRQECDKSRPVLRGTKKHCLFFFLQEKYRNSNVKAVKENSGPVISSSLIWNTSLKATFIVYPGIPFCRHHNSLTHTTFNTHTTVYSKYQCSTVQLPEFSCYYVMYGYKYGVTAQTGYF